MLVAKVRMTKVEGASVGVGCRELVRVVGTRMTVVWGGMETVKWDIYQVARVAAWSVEKEH